MYRVFQKEKLFKKNTYSDLLINSIQRVFNSLYTIAMYVFLDILYSYLVGCCLISDLFGLGFPLPNKSDIGKAPDQTTVLLFPPRMLILLVIRGSSYFKS